ncbi:MAG TPA: DinB family protein [Cyclobacteriaceae bacterium]|nr:DinB family protein [Cyclobacteriaceae bacterium]
MKKFTVPAFYQGYVKLATEENIVEGLENNEKEILDFFVRLAGEKFNYRYAPGKWTVREVLQHVTDNERILSYRALRISRGDKTPLAGYEQDDYVNALKINHLRNEDLIGEWRAVRHASKIQFRNMHPDLYEYEGFANNNNFNVEFLGRVIIGHARHHLEILKERYLK